MSDENLMIKIMKACSLAIVLGVSPQFAWSDDLTLPPEFRHPAPAGSDTPVSGTPSTEKNAAPKKQKQAKKPAAEKRTAETPNSQLPQQPPSQTSAGVSKPQNNNPMSFGLKWNADNTPSTGGPNTSGLFNDYNRNVNGQTVGTGAQLGVKYGF